MDLVATPITPEVIFEFLHDGIREDDEKEYLAHSGQPLETLKDSLMALVGKEQEAYAEAVHTTEGTLVALGGWDLLGASWFLCTDAVQDHARSFVRHIKARRDALLKAVHVITNEVWIGNGVHVRFLEALGAEFSTRVFQRGGLEFTRFYIQQKGGPHV